MHNLWDSLTQEEINLLEGRNEPVKVINDPLVKEVTEETMAGETLLHKRLNAYLTKRFILDKDVPADECIAEVDEIIKMVEDFYGITDTDNPEDY